MKNPIFVALDTSDLGTARTLTDTLAGHVGGIKLGLEFYAANGPGGVQSVARPGLPIFLDLKFHDIPNTVAGAVRAVTPLAPAILNVHASGGPAMMRAARDAAHEAAGELGIAPPRVIAVTVLTSLGDDDLPGVGQAGSARSQAVRLARLARDSGLDGVVCAPTDVRAIREVCGPRFLLVTPGVRPDWAAKGDQKRVATPAATLAAGADYLVIGRPITASDDPAAAAARILGELNGS
jgi:orotidine-5'-phosphate decarboxylase